MGAIALMMFFLVVAFFTMPIWPYAARWGSYAAGACGGLALIIAGLALGGRL